MQPVVLVKGFFLNTLFIVSVSLAAVHNIFESLFILSPCAIILPIKKTPNLLFLLAFSSGFVFFQGKEIIVSYGLRCKGGIAD